MTNRYLVVSYDNDQQQTFYDVVLAGSAIDAENLVADARLDYAVVADVELLEEFKGMILGFDQLTDQDIMEEQAELEKQAKENNA